MKSPKRSKAFTLTELLVVVVVVGVLAGVGIPKFNQVLETRRTTEAESLMTAVRTEQEKRCSFEKPYAGTFERLSDIVSRTPSGGSKTASSNYTYELEPQGIKAQSARKAYALKIPSYKDGQLCCEGEYCTNLNKSYPDCASMSFSVENGCSAPVCELDPAGCACNPNQCKCPDYAASHCECTGTCVIECPAGSKPDASCNTCGTRSVTCDNSTGAWTTGVCSVASPADCAGSECTNGQTQGSQACNSCGTQTTQKCVNGYWTNSLGVCSIASSADCTGSECSEGQTKGSETCNTCGTRTTHTCKNGYWTALTGVCSVASASECVKECPAASKPSANQPCGNCGTQTRSVTCNGANGEWESGEWGACSDEGECAANMEESQTCDTGFTGDKKRTCSAECKWGAWKTDSCKPKSTVKPVIKSGVTIATCSQSGAVTSYSVYKSGSNVAVQQSHRYCECVYEGRRIECTSEIYSPNVFAIPEGFGDVGEKCSGSDYQSLCDAGGVGFTCFISASPSCGTKYKIIGCDCSTSACNADRNEECECMEEDAPYPVEYAGGSGGASYLSCEAG